MGRGYALVPDSVELRPNPGRHSRFPVISSRELSGIRAHRTPIADDGFSTESSAGPAGSARATGEAVALPLGGAQGGAAATSASGLNAREAMSGEP
jgi:hypothetical protein